MRALVIALAFASSTAVAAPKETEVIGGASNDLYIRKRPRPPSRPLPHQLRAMIDATERLSTAKRLEAIALLRSFLDSKPSDDAKADGLFKLAELVWEEARNTYLTKMDAYGRALEDCRRRPCALAPVEPRIDLSDAGRLYRELHDHHPTYRRMDLVTYLMAFAATESGDDASAQASFREVIAKFPRSPLVGDAWLQIGELQFRGANWAAALDSYKRVPATASAYDFALFKRAWCSWQLGDTVKAADDFKLVIEETIQRERIGARGGKRGIPLRDQAIEYLVIVFTEDRSVTPKEVFTFLGKMDPTFSRDILVRVGDSYAGQSEYARSDETWRFLVGLEPRSLRAADFRRRIVDNALSAGDEDRVRAALQQLLDEHGPRSAWTAAQPDKAAVAASLDATEQLARKAAITLHAEAQRTEKALRRKPASGCIAKSDLPADLEQRYERAAETYARYDRAFPSAIESNQLRYYRADILCFKLGRPEEAGDAYLAVGRTAPAGVLHKEALLNAMSAYELARPPVRGKLHAVDKKLGDAVDLYASLFKDGSLGTVLFKTGQMYFDAEAWDAAVPRFARVVRDYPADPNAGPAGDRILRALATAEKYDELAAWAQELGKHSAFAAPDQRARLAQVHAGALGNSADALAGAGKHSAAAAKYLAQRAVAVDPAVAGQALMNAGVMFDRARLVDRAGAAYSELATAFATTRPDLAEKGALAAGRLYEDAMLYDRAAAAYELVTTKFAGSPRVADALYSAGVMRQALAERGKAIAHYRDFAKRFPSHARAADVAFYAGVVHEDAGDDGPAHAAFRDYLATFSSTGKRVAEAWTRAGRTSFRLGQLVRARDELAAAKRAAGKTAADKTWAAEARYFEGELVLREFQAISFVKIDPAKVGDALAKKTQLLDTAEKVYVSVASYHDPRWAVAALARTAQIYDEYGDALVEAVANPPPLSAAQRKAYEDKVNTYVVAVQSKAITLYEAAYKMALDLQLYDDTTIRIRKKLARLSPASFTPDAEARQKIRLGDRAPAPPLVDTIQR